MSDDAEIAVAEQRPITIAVCADGEIELTQQYDGRMHAVYVRPENVIGLVDRIFRSAAGHHDLFLHRTVGSALWCDVPWPSDELDDPDPPVAAETVAALVPAPPPSKDRTAAERMRRYRNKRRTVTPDRNTPHSTVTQPDLLRALRPEKAGADNE